MWKAVVFHGEYFLRSVLKVFGMHVKCRMKLFVYALIASIFG